MIYNGMYLLRWIDLVKKVLTIIFLVVMPLYSYAFDKPSFVDSYSGIEFKKLNNKTYLAVYEVTQEQWYKVMNTAPFSFNKGGLYPAESVSIGDIQKFLNNLNAKTQSNYRLPTVAEWKEAAGEVRINRDDVCSYANFYDISSNAVNRFGNAYFECDDKYPNTAPVGSFAANSKGYYDLFGNVKEWLCNSESDRTNTCANLLGAASLAVAGGGFSDGPREMRKYIKDERTSLRYAGLGFRLAIDAASVNPDTITDGTNKPNVIAPVTTVPVTPSNNDNTDNSYNPSSAFDNQRNDVTNSPNFTNDNKQSNDQNNEPLPERKFKFLPFLRD